MIDEYVAEIGRRLAMPARRRARIIEDIRDHLDDSITLLVSTGIDPRIAERRAIESFGLAPDMADQFNTDAAVGVLRRTPPVMAASGLAVAAAFVFAAVSRPSRPPASASLLQQIAFFFGVLGMQLALVAGARVLMRVGAHWQTAPTAADHRLVRRAGFMFSTGLAAAALGWTVALAAANDGPSPPRSAPYIAGSVVMILAAIVAWVTTTGRRAPATGDDNRAPDGSLLGTAERTLQWLSRWPRTWCACAAILAGLAAMSHAETTPRGTLLWGVIQAAAVVAGFVLLGPMLELRRSASSAASPST
jgi:hypothetical protein